jgi:hypothetical protein
MKKLTETRPKISLAILFLGLAATSFATAADLNVPTTVYPAIQAAVNAAHTNDTIHIAPGVYTGQVRIISKTLTLTGQPGTILRATTNMSSFPGSVHVPIIGTRFSQVTVRGLAFEGERLAERFVGPGDLEGILFRQSSGIVETARSTVFVRALRAMNLALPLVLTTLKTTPLRSIFAWSEAHLGKISTWFQGGSGTEQLSLFVGGK